MCTLFIPSKQSHDNARHRIEDEKNGVREEFPFSRLLLCITSGSVLACCLSPTCTKRIYWISTTTTTIAGCLLAASGCIRSVLQWSLASCIVCELILLLFECIARHPISINRIFTRRRISFAVISSLCCLLSQYCDGPMPNHSRWPSTDDYLHFILSSFGCDHTLTLTAPDSIARALNEQVSAKMFDLYYWSQVATEHWTHCFFVSGRMCIASFVYSFACAQKIDQCSSIVIGPRTSNQSIYKMNSSFSDRIDGKLNRFARIGESWHTTLYFAYGLLSHFGFSRRVYHCLDFGEFDWNMSVSGCEIWNIVVDNRIKIGTTKWVGGRNRMLINNWASLTVSSSGRALAKCLTHANLSNLLCFDARRKCFVINSSGSGVLCLAGASPKSCHAHAPRNTRLSQHATVSLVSFWSCCH